MLQRDGTEEGFWDSDENLIKVGEKKGGFLEELRKKAIIADSCY